MRIGFTFIVLHFLALSIQAQFFTLQGEVDVVADNREYFSSIQNPQTIFGTLLAPELQHKIDDKQSISFGAALFYEFGSFLPNSAWQATAYYQLKDERFQFLAGSFPRRSLIDNYSPALLYDTLNYFRPNVEGLFLRHQSSIHFAEAWIDWLGRQNATTPEMFVVGARAQINAGISFAQISGTLQHVAGTNPATPNEHIQDNAAVIPKIGLDFSNKIKDSLTIAVGSIYGVDRLRGVYGFQEATGAFVEALWTNKNIGINAMYYFGEAQNILLGDAFYARDSYGRADLIWHVLNKNNVTIDFSLSFHFSEKLDSQQKLLIKIPLGNAK